MDLATYLTLIAVFKRRVELFQSCQNLSSKRQSKLRRSSFAFVIFEHLKRKQPPEFSRNLRPGQLDQSASAQQIIIDTHNMADNETSNVHSDNKLFRLFKFERVLYEGAMLRIFC